MRRALRFNARAWPALTLGLLAAITILSLVPPSDMGPLGGGNDKLRHFLAYGALATPVGLARPRALGLILLAAAIWSGVLELLQPLVRRETAFADFAANCAGLGLGTIVAAGARRLTSSDDGRSRVDAG